MDANHQPRIHLNTSSAAEVSEVLRPGEGWWTDEEGYPQYLEAERRLFAWCLMRLGGFTEEAAVIEALSRYPYEPPDTLYRGMVFHRVAWTWAMWRLFGDDHKTWPAIDPAIRAEYEREADHWHQRV